MVAKKYGLDCPTEMVDYLVQKHYTACSRPLRRCHARDLLDQIRHYCEYNEIRPLVNEEHLDYAVRNYFTALQGEQVPCFEPTKGEALGLSGQSQTLARSCN
jgi:hypothetical protein